QHGDRTRGAAGSVNTLGDTQESRQTGITEPPQFTIHEMVSDDPGLLPVMAELRQGVLCKLSRFGNGQAQRIPLPRMSLRHRRAAPPMLVKLARGLPPSLVQVAEQRVKTAILE